METERLQIRRFTPEDWQDLYEYLSLPEVVHYEPYGVYSQEQAKEEAVSRSQNPDFWAVCLKSTGKCIGNLYLAKQGQDTWELGYVFHTAYQGKGYATEAAEAMMDDLFTKGAAHRIVAMCDPRNIASWRLLERLHLRREGILLQNVWFEKDEEGNPLWKDTYEYAILREEWQFTVHPQENSNGV